MSKNPQVEVHIDYSEYRLDTLALFRYIRDLEFNRLAKERNATKATLKTILYTLATYRNVYTAKCNPDQRTIADNCGIHRDTVIRCIQKLEDAGVIIIVNIGKVGMNFKNHYYFSCEMEELSNMYNDMDHAIHKTSEDIWIERAIDIFETMS